MAPGQDVFTYALSLVQLGEGAGAGSSRRRGLFLPRRKRWILTDNIIILDGVEYMFSPECEKSNRFSFLISPEVVLLPSWFGGIIVGR